MAWLWVFLAVLVLVVLGLWLSWTATRLDRMHHRIELARASLDAQLLHRSGAALELATAQALDPARSLLLADAAHQARAASAEQLEASESDLSEALRAVLDDRDELLDLGRDTHLAALLAELSDACGKVELARRFHNDVVASARMLRSRRRVRWLRLSGRAGRLQTVDLDDVPPAGLAGDWSSSAGPGSGS